ncbi:hypothetical protein JOD54_004179 [Actinokineospora baliensis]|uniref:hypothetical protein n=1 Tax=Actinokineospora baliensis TaxID=547056 RepID=UPI001957780F|nr:hypothetical protein [Actinokineospora baliensis]MBM7773975.1 hypothetical protein [Actinokineospora baliensis]
MSENLKVRRVSRGVVVAAVFAVAVAWLFGYWTVRETAIEHARTCPETCLTHETATVVDTEFYPGGERGGSGSTITIKLASGDRYEISGTTSVGSSVEISTWGGQLIRVGDAWVDQGWASPVWRFFLIPPLFAALVFALFFLAGRPVLGLGAGVLGGLLALVAIVARVLPWWPPVALGLVALLLVKPQRV